MWFIVRLIRRPFVLAIIFLFSLTYCVINLFGSNKKHVTIDDSEFKLHREHPIIWRTVDQSNLVNRTGDSTQKCRNSVQGKSLIVDEHGYVCDRLNLLLTGCCNLDTIATGGTQSQYSCDTCNPDGTSQHCCEIYENCVSCCLNPNKVSILEKVLKESIGRQMAIFATVTDHFEFCLAKCRTDSHSVQHENKYKDPLSKHCYGLTEFYRPNEMNDNQLGANLDIFIDKKHKLDNKI